MKLNSPCVKGRIYTWLKDIKKRAILAKNDSKRLVEALELLFYRTPMGIQWEHQWEEQSVIKMSWKKLTHKENWFFVSEQDNPCCLVENTRSLEDNPSFLIKPREVEKLDCDMMMGLLGCGECVYTRNSRRRREDMMLSSLASPHAITSVSDITDRPSDRRLWTDMMANTPFGKGYKERRLHRLILVCRLLHKGKFRELQIIIILVCLC